MAVLRRRPSSMLILSAATMTATACSLVVDTAGLVGPEAITAPDAEAGIDASDAATLADRQADSPEVRRCDATFCDDFDEGGVEGRWTSQEIASTGSLVLEDADRTTKPNALHAELANPAGDYRYAVLRKEFPITQKIACEVDIKILRKPEVDFVDLVRFETSGGSLERHWLWFGIQSSGGMFREDRFYKEGGCDCPVKWATPPSLVVGRWTRVRFETDLQRARVSYDGVLVVDEPVVTFTASAPMILSLGVSGPQLTSGEALFDGLVCTVAP